MKFLMIVCLVAGMFSVGGVSDEESTDSVHKELINAKDEYINSVNKAKDKLLSAFAEQQEKLIKNKNLKTAELIKLVDQLQKERDAFIANISNLPRSVSMKVAVSEYQKSIDAAKKKCAEVYDKAAEQYRKNRNLALIKETLTDKDTFLSTVPCLGPPDVREALTGKWQVKFLGTTRNGSKIDYQATWEFDRFGKVLSEEAKISGTWNYDYKD